jgi:hypothetical protein
VGPFRLADAVSPAALAERLAAAGAEREAGDAELGTAWVPFDDIQLPFGEIALDSQQERRILNGQTVLIRDLESREGDWLKVTNQRRQFIAVGAVVERIGSGGVGVVQPKVVFH